jgi:hypothetical protein
MKGERNSIFRPDALRRYAENNEKMVLPRLVRPRAFLYLWILLGLLLAVSTLVGWSARKQLLREQPSAEPSRR